MESYRGIDFWKTRWTVSGNVNTSRKVLFSYSVSDGDQIRFVADAFRSASTSLTRSSARATGRPL